MLARDRAFLGALLLFAALTCFAALNGARWLEQRRASIRSERALNVETQVPVSRLTHRAVLEPAPLAALAIGRGDLDPFSARVSMLTGRHALHAQWQIASPLTLLAGRFDLAFLIVVLFPLLIIALAYNVLAAERERGTLLMVLSQPVRVRTLLAAKIGVRAIAVLGSAVALTGVAGLCVVDPDADGASIALAAWLGATLLYGAFWFGLALWVNATGARPATNAVALVTAWVALVIVMPAALNLVVTAMHPLPSRLALLQATRAIDNETARTATKLLDRFYHDHPELVPAADRAHFTRVSYAARLEQERRLLPAVVAFERQLEAQQAAIDRYRFASPAVLTSELLTRIAGNDRVRFLAWQESVRAFVLTWRERFVRDFYLGRPVARGTAVPQFRFDETPRSGAHAAGSLLGLAAMALVVTAAGLLALRRFSVGS